MRPLCIDLFCGLGGFPVRRLKHVDSIRKEAAAILEHGFDSRGNGEDAPRVIGLPRPDFNVAGPRVVRAFDVNVGPLERDSFAGANSGIQRERGEVAKGVFSHRQIRRLLSVGQHELPALLSGQPGIGRRGSGQFKRLSGDIQHPLQDGHFPVDAGNRHGVFAVADVFLHDGFVDQVQPALSQRFVLEQAPDLLFVKLHGGRVIAVSGPDELEEVFLELLESRPRLIRSQAVDRQREIRLGLRLNLAGLSSVAEFGGRLMPLAVEPERIPVDAAAFVYRHTWPRIIAHTPSEARA
jgi:hypothetical protein